jgi:signal transduction histidine kinase
VDYSPGTEEVFSDPRILRNILFNLLSNASKYSDVKKSIYLSVTVNAQELILALRDEGIGIPEEEHRFLFDRFFRAANVSNIQGTGLGLNIVKRYVELLDGTIDFKSTLGTGSTFTVTIPLKLPHAKNSVNRR